jgi:L-2,4-diaminobutyric acid acetyltransferase
MTITETGNRPDHLQLRTPGLTDGAEIHNLVKNSHPLDLNSLYCYLLICEHFNETSVVVQHEDSIKGFISAYIHPKKDDTLFIWQVAVDSSMRKMGLAMKMAMVILGRDNARKIKFIETTVSPSNEASSRFFHSLASTLKTGLTKETFITDSMFGKEAHEEEILFRIGPFESPGL